MLWKALGEAGSGDGTIASGGRGIAPSVIISQAIANALRLMILTGVRCSERRKYALGTH